MGGGLWEVIRFRWGPEGGTPYETVFLQEEISLALSPSLSLPLDLCPHMHPGICEPYLNSQQSFANMIKLSILRQEVILDAPGGSDVTMPVLQAETGEQKQAVMNF